MQTTTAPLNADRPKLSLPGLRRKTAAPETSPPPKAPAAAPAPPIAPPALGKKARARAARTARRARQEIGAALIARLNARFPEIFVATGMAPTPLAIGIHKALALAMPEMSGRERKTALAFFTCAPRYRACLIEGAIRIALDGSPAGAVTASEAQHAQERAGKAGAPATPVALADPGPPLTAPGVPQEGRAAEPLPSGGERPEGAQAPAPALAPRRRRSKPPAADEQPQAPKPEVEKRAPRTRAIAGKRRAPAAG